MLAHRVRYAVAASIFYILTWRFRAASSAFTGIARTSRLTCYLCRFIGTDNAAGIVRARGQKGPKMNMQFADAIAPTPTKSDPDIARKQAQIVAIRAASPMRPIDGRTADVDGLALFDAVRSPCLI